MIISIFLRPCETGEELLLSGKCQVCDPGTYLLTPQTEPSPCLNCPNGDVAECLGGDLFFPMPGYWRSNITSDNLNLCRNDVACLGQNGAENNLLGACADGYSGILCADCEVGYSTSGSDYKCSPCPSQGSNIGRIIGILIVLVIALILIARSNITSTPKKPAFISAFMRLLMNHLQVLVIISGYDLQWPPQLQKFFTSSKPITEISQQFLSIDCFLDERQPLNTSLTNVVFTSITGQVVTYDSTYQEFEEEAGIHRIFFKKVIMYAVLPFFIIIISAVVWQIIFWIQAIMQKSSQLQSLQKKKSSQLEIQSAQSSQLEGVSAVSDNEKESSLLSSEIKVGRILTTIIVILFLLHPNLTKIMFSAFKCQTIDGVQRLYDDLQVVCYSDVHNKMAYGVSLPALLLWGIGIPSFALYLIIKNRKQLQNIHVRNMYGFLYNGYKQTSYYWEFVIIYRKIIMIFIQIFVAQAGKLVQALALLVFLILNVSLHGAKQPFINHMLNNLEMMSLLSQSITIYCGVFYIASNAVKSSSQFALNDNSLTFFFAMIIFFNVLFFAYWLYHFLKELRLNIRKKLPKLYLALFLCQKKQKLDLEQELDQFKDVLDPFIQKCDTFQQYLAQRKKMYLAGKIPIEDESFKSILRMALTLRKNVEDQTKYLKQDSKFVRVEDLVKMKTGGLSIGDTSSIKRQKTNLLDKNKLFGNKKQSKQSVVDISDDEDFKDEGDQERKQDETKVYENFTKTFNVDQVDLSSSKSRRESQKSMKKYPYSEANVDMNGIKRAKKLEDSKSIMDDEQVFDQQWGDERDGPTMKGTLKGNQFDRRPNASVISAEHVSSANKHRNEREGTDGEGVPYSKKDPG